MNQRIIEIVGSENISFEDSDRSAYAVDASQEQGTTQAVVWPDDYERLRQLIRYAARTNTSVVVRGAGTSLTGGTIPNDSIVVDLSRQNKILSINLKEKTATVQAGTVLDNLNKTLSKYNLKFPIIPTSHAVCTIGGMIATNASGMRAVKYGTIKEWVEEVDVIDGTGKAFTIKNPEEIIGSEGKLAIILKAKLKLTGLPTTKTMTVYTFNHSLDLMEKVEEIKQEPTLTALEMYDKTTTKTINGKEEYMLMAEFESEDKGEIKNQEKVNQVWTERKKAIKNLYTKGYTIMEDVQVPLTDIPKVLNWLRKNNIPTYGHIATGILHPHFRKGQQNKINELLEMVTQMGGKAAGQHGYGSTKTKYYPLDGKINTLKMKYNAEEVLR